MNPSILNNKDVWAGLMLICIGAAAMFFARNYPFGTALRMGPGYFPMLLGGLLILFGLYILASGLAQRPRRSRARGRRARSSSCRCRWFSSAC